MKILLSIDMPMRGKIQRERATHLRRQIELLGYTKLQSNLYLKTVKDHFNVRVHSASINNVLPTDSSARIIVLTERQYESMILISCEKSSQEMLVGAQRQLVF